MTGGESWRCDWGVGGVTRVGGVTGGESWRCDGGRELEV